jgi:archaellum biogenesis ATPase FlaH
VYVDGNYVNYFSKTGGTIYGNTGDGKGNVVKDFTTGDVLNDKSHAVYVHNTTSAYIKQRHTTARAADRLSYIGRLNLLPVWSGDWD